MAECIPTPDTLTAVPLVRHKKPIGDESVADEVLLIGIHSITLHGVSVMMHSRNVQTTAKAIVVVSIQSPNCLFVLFGFF